MQAISSGFFVVVYLLFCQVAYGILVPLSGIKPVSPAVEAQS